MRHVPSGPRSACGPYALAVLLRCGTQRSERLLRMARAECDPRLRRGRVFAVRTNQMLRVLRDEGIRGDSYWQDARRRIPLLGEWLLTMAHRYDRRMTLVDLSAHRGLARKHRRYGHFIVAHRGHVIDNLTRRWVRYGDYPYANVFDLKPLRWWTVDRALSGPTAVRGSR